MNIGRLSAKVAIANNRFNRAHCDD